MSITTAQICDAIKATLSTAAALKVSQSYNQLTEGANDLPLMQVYPESGNTDASTENDRTTFQGGVRQANVTVHVDVYARQRSQIGEDMAKVVTLVDQIIPILEAQDTKPYFGLVGIRSFKWNWSRVVFTYGAQDARYAGIRFVLEIRVF